LGFPAARKCNPTNPALKQTGWALKPIGAESGGSSSSDDPDGSLVALTFPGGAGGLIVADCNGTDPAQTFHYNSTTFQLVQVSSKHCVDVHSGGPIVWMCA
jgi:hypothetical protein